MDIDVECDQVGASENSYGAPDLVELFPFVKEVAEESTSSLDIMPMDQNALCALSQVQSVTYISLEYANVSFPQER
jgi:hypothetical protein